MKPSVRALVALAAVGAVVVGGLVGAQALADRVRPTASTESFHAPTTARPTEPTAPSVPATTAPQPAVTSQETPAPQPAAAPAAPAPKLKPIPTTKPAVAGSAPCAAPRARACVDLSANKSWLMDGNGGVTYGPVPITHGRPGWLTPPGTFRVTRKNIDHKSSLFNGAPMPYSVFFNGGIAFHEGSLSETSHGCIHLSRAAARTFFEHLQLGEVVQVVP